MPIRELQTRVNRIAQSESPVLIVGEAGTGKENVARNIHYRSERHAGPFVPVNCSAIPGELLESELFGHRKGAFSGAVSDRDGRLALASEGTLFLDEVADLPLELQERMLSVLDEKVAHRVGCREPFPVTARLVAATRYDLEESVRRGDFRQDLLTRLGAYLVHVPGLRERKEDIPQLAAEIGFQIQRELGTSIVLSPESVACLRMHDWPGNLRELTNLIERLAALRPDGIARVADLPVEYQREHRWPEGQIQALHALNGQRTDLAEVMRYTEANLIRQAIDQADGGIAQAATILNISHATLVEKIEQLGLEDFLATRSQS
jgi:sigma-54 specific flagellar transcriptional regulator A